MICAMMREEGLCGWLLHTHTGQGACMELTTIAPRGERKRGERKKGGEKKEERERMRRGKREKRGNKEHIIHPLSLSHPPPSLTTLPSSPSSMSQACWKQAGHTQNPQSWHTQWKLKSVVAHVSQSSRIPFTARFHTGMTVREKKEGRRRRREGGKERVKR